MIVYIKLLSLLYFCHSKERQTFKESGAITVACYLHGTRLCKRRSVLVIASLRTRNDTSVKQSLEFNIQVLFLSFKTQKDNIFKTAHRLVSKVYETTFSFQWIFRQFSKGEHKMCLRCLGIKRSQLILRYRFR